MSNCTKCGKCEDDCGCIPRGLTTPNYCPSDLPPCPQPSPCNETFDTKCIIYTGKNLPCIGVEHGDSVEQVILALNNKLSPLFCLECASLNIPANNATNIPYDQTLNWNAVPGATSYDVYFGTSPTTPPLVSAGQILTVYIYPYPLLPGTDYYWKVVPKNGTGAAQNCAIYHFKTKELTCVNPLSYMLEYAVSEQPVTTPPSINVGTLVESIGQFLDNGELITNCNFCCPDCKDTHRYVLASAPLYANYYSQFYNLPNCPLVCCTEVDASLTAMTTKFNDASLALATAFKNVPPVTNCCGTNFSECSEALKVALGTERDAIFKVLGVVEESTISGTTQLCILATFLNSLPAAVTDAEKASIIAVILTKGFVVDCREEGTIISGLQKYKQYITAAQDGCLCYKPCVIP